MIFDDGPQVKNTSSNLKGRPHIPYFCTKKNGRLGVKKVNPSTVTRNIFVQKFLPDFVRLQVFVPFFLKKIVA